jgi:hypothetical protein
MGMVSPQSKEAFVKRLIATLALAALASPASGLAAPTDLRLHDPRVASSSLGVPPDLRAPDQQSPSRVAPRLPASGTDAAAPDQQSPSGGFTPAPAPAPSGSDFDWGDAGIGAGSAICLLSISLGSAVGIRRRRVRRPSALAG